MITLGRTVLREVRDEDINLLHRIRNDLTMQMEFGQRPRPTTVEAVRQWTERMASTPTTVFFVVAEQGSERALGYVKVAEIDAVHGLGHLRIALDPMAQGRGHGGEALTLIERYVADVFGLRKLVLHVLASNEGAMRRYQRSGWREVGRHLGHWYFRSAWHDVVVMERAIPL